MKLLAAGGGSGGHVTPVLAVISELSTIDDQLEVMFVCDRAFESQSRGLMNHALVPVTVETIPAGKLRRYHGESIGQRLRDVRTIALNLRDIFKIIGGFFKSLWIIMRFRPDVVFAKGGFVCLPLGLAAHIARVPIVVHDSDTRPGLTNSVLARFARRIATGSPLENYRYDPARSVYTGVPVDAAFRPLTPEEQRAAKSSIGVIDLSAPLVVVTGGGLGARSINEAMVRAGSQLMERGIHVYHITGKGQFESLKHRLPDHAHYITVPFVYMDMASVLGAAGLVVARGSATFLQELAGLEKPVIIIPASQLGDQVKNAVVYEDAEAAKVLSDHELSSSDALPQTILALLGDHKQMSKLSHNLHQFARPHAAADLAKIIIETHSKRDRS